MRTTRTEQPSVFQAPQIGQPVADELEVASLLLDQHPELLDMVGRCVGGSATCGRVGLTCETILRCAVIARLMDCSSGSWSSCCTIRRPRSALRGWIRGVCRRSRRCRAPSA